MDLNLKKWEPPAFLKVNDDEHMEDTVRLQ